MNQPSYSHKRDSVHREEYLENGHESYCVYPGKQLGFAGIVKLELLCKMSSTSPACQVGLKVLALNGPCSRR